MSLPTMQAACLRTLGGGVVLMSGRLYTTIPAFRRTIPAGKRWLCLGVSMYRLEWIPEPQHWIDESKTQTTVRSRLPGKTPCTQARFARELDAKAWRLARTCSARAERERHGTRAVSRA